MDLTQFCDSAEKIGPGTAWAIKIARESSAGSLGIIIPASDPNVAFGYANVFGYRK
jgi:hypothetical protein